MYNNMASRAFLAWRMLVEAELEDRRNERRRYKVCMRALRKDPLHYYGDRKFIKLYRLSKKAFVDLCDLLERYTDLRCTQRASPKLKILCALRFYAKGRYQCAIGMAHNFSQEDITDYINQVTKALMHPSILKRFLRFPATRRERDDIRQRFYASYGIPEVVGCIDSVHFQMMKPTKKDEDHLYYCRKNYYSINVQMICDADARILAVNPKFGGATNKDFIWETSNINNYMQTLHGDNEQTWLLGDSGYPQQPWIMTPYEDSDGPLNSEQELYNKKHSKARVVIENMFGLLRKRWRCCTKFKALKYEPVKCTEIITACCVLHNIAVQYDMPEPEDEDDDDNDTFVRHHIYEEYEDDDLSIGRALREQLVKRLASQE